jgi:hypothetical protein
MILCVDPGLSMGSGGTGWAVFNDDSLIPERTGVIRSGKGTWQQRAENICITMEHMLNYSEICDVRMLAAAYIELPTFFQNEKGLTCATGKDGDDSDLVKLSYLVGRIAGMFYMWQVPVTTVRINGAGGWKGTGMGKMVVAHRIADRLGLKAEGRQDDPKLVRVKGGEAVISSHAIDAVGIGLHIKGVFKANAKLPQERPGSGIARASYRRRFKGRN